MSDDDWSSEVAARGNQNQTWKKTNLTRLSGFPALSAAINTLAAAAAAVSSGETRSRRSEEVQEGPRVQEEERWGRGGGSANK